MTPQPRCLRRAIASGGIIAVLIIVVLLALGAWWLRSGSSAQATSTDGDSVVVRRGSFDITIPTSGELAALKQIEIKNELDSRAIITEIEDEGVRVEAGDVLLRFNDEQILENIKDAEDAVEVAQNDLETTQANLEIRKKTRESRMAAAALNIRLAELALSSWTEGDDVTSRQDFELRVKTAEKEHARAKDRYEAAQRLAEKNFLSQDELARDEITLIRAESELEKARLQQRVYIDYDSVREREEKESDLKQAIDEEDREQQRLDAEVRSAESDVDSRGRRLESRQERLAKWQEQRERCTITAPSGGLVVYASSLESGGYRGRDEEPPQVGTEVSPNRTVMVLPDVAQMIAAVKVNEALSGLIERGQSATIVSDALPDAILHGEVLNVGVLAESGGWRDPNRRDYTVRILLKDADGLGLKPSMRCKATIEVGRVADSLHVPIQAVFRNGGVPYLYVKAPGGWAERAVRLGEASEMYVQIIEGVDENSVVLLREPSPAEIVERLDPARARGPQMAMNGRGKAPQAGEQRGRPGGGDRPGRRSGGGERPGGADGRDAREPAGDRASSGEQRQPPARAGRP